jgi:anti-sigma B factor antagonist
MRKLKLETREAGKVRIVDVKGELRLGETEPLEQATKSLIEGGHASLVINMEGVPWLDTGGISALLACKRWASKMGGDVKLLKLSDHVWKVLVIAYLHRNFDIFDDELKAVGSF